MTRADLIQGGRECPWEERERERSVQGRHMSAFDSLCGNHFSTLHIYEKGTEQRWSRVCSLELMG